MADLQASDSDDDDDSDVTSGGGTSTDSYIDANNGSGDAEDVDEDDTAQVGPGRPDASAAAVEVAHLTSGFLADCFPPEGDAGGSSDPSSPANEPVLLVLAPVAPRPVSGTRAACARPPSCGGRAAWGASGGRAAP